MRLLGAVLDSCEQANWPLLNRGTAKNAKDVLDEISGELFKVSSICQRFQFNEVVINSVPKSRLFWVFHRTKQFDQKNELGDGSGVRSIKCDPNYEFRTQGCFWKRTARGAIEEKT